MVTARRPAKQPTKKQVTAPTPMRIQSTRWPGSVRSASQTVGLVREVAPPHDSARPTRGRSHLCHHDSVCFTSKFGNLSSRKQAATNITVQSNPHTVVARQKIAGFTLKLESGTLRNISTGPPSQTKLCGATVPGK